jgi:hypothetical protein
VAVVKGMGVVLMGNHVLQDKSRSNPFGAKGLPVSSGGIFITTERKIALSEIRRALQSLKDKEGPAPPAAGTPGQRTRCHA